MPTIVLVAHGDIGGPQGLGDPQGQAAQDGPHRAAQPAQDGDDKGFQGERPPEIREKIDRREAAGVPAADQGGTQAVGGAW